MTRKIKDKIKAFLPEKWPSFCQFRKISEVLNEKEKAIFLIAAVSFAVSLIVLISFFYFQGTEKAPKPGGKYIEGMIGNPQFLNPVYSSLSDTDRDISNVLFSGLVKYGSTEELIFDLVEDIRTYGKVYEITLKENLYWSDGEKITADDVVFTVETIQNPKTRSPLRPGWVGVEVEKISEKEISFKLEQESSIFLNRLSLQLIPYHIWKEVALENLILSPYNLKPVSSGPYRVKEKIQNQQGKIEQINLEVNPYYHGKKPYIQEISFVFFDDFEKIINASQRKEIHGFSTISPKNYNEIIKETKFEEHLFRIPRYFGLFLNLEEKPLNDKKFREALNYGINKQEILEKVLSGKGGIVNSPVLPEIYGFGFSEEHEFNLEKANEILDNLGFKKNEQGWREKMTKEAVSFEFKSDLRIGSQGDEVRQLQECLTEEGIYQDEITGFFGTETRSSVNLFQEKYKDEVLTPSGFSKGTGMISENTRRKLNEICKSSPHVMDEINFTITTVNQSLMEETAEKIKKQWQELGIRININLLEIGSLENNAIKPRNYEILLFGKALDYVPDFFPFWHSSQKTEYGFNLSMYENKEVDKITEEIRKNSNMKGMENEIKQLSDLIIKDIPAIFLFNPDYVFYASKDIKGIETRTIFSPSQRFHNIEEWYVRTRRAWK